MYLLWLIPESYIRRGEDSLALQSRERRGEKKRRAERNSQANRGRQQSGENKRQRHSAGSLMKGLRRAHRFGRTNRNKSALLQTSLSEVVGPSQLCFFLFISFFAAGPSCVWPRKTQLQILFYFFYFFIFLVLIRRSTVTQRAQRHGLINT